MTEPSLKRQQRGWPRSSVRSAAIIACLLAAAALEGRATPLTEPPPDEDPVPIRRVLLHPAQLADELERVRRGVLLQMPRSDFDALSRRAATAQQSGQSPPALLETRYRASLAADALVGTAQWRILAAGPTPAVLPVEPLHLAVRNVRWSDDRAAVLGELDTRQKGAELLIERSGEQALSFNWSARGVPEPGGVRFDLRVPACAIATLDLELPPGHEPMCQRDGCLVTGPTPASVPERRAWRLLFGGGSQLELVIRPPAGTGPHPIVMVRQQNVQDLSPSQAICDFSLDLDVGHGGVRELRLEYEAGLRPIDVSVRNLARWQILEGDEDSPNQIAVEFGEPFRGGSLAVRAVGPVPTNRPWVSPWVRVSGGVPRGEQIVIRAHPELAYEDWKAGSFRLQDVAVAADRSVAWTLQGGAVRAAPTRPSARFKLRGPEYKVRQNLWWQIGADGGETLTAHCTFDVRRGPVFQVPWSVPADWTVQDVEATPTDSLAAWSVAPPAANGGPATLNVEFLHPLVPNGAGKVQMTLVRSRAGRIANSSLSLIAPDIMPIAAVGREGTLAVKVSPEYQAMWDGGSDARGALTTSAAGPSADTAPSAPWAPAAADFVVNLGPHRLASELSLRKVPSQYRCHGATNLTVVGRLARITHRLAIEPLSGGTDTILVRSTTDDDATWHWRVVSGDNRMRGVQRVDVAAAVARAGIAAASPWAAIATAASPMRRGEHFLLVRLERPIIGPVELQADVELLVPPSDETRATDWVSAMAAGGPLQTLPLSAGARAAGAWPLPVPLVSVPAAASHTSTVTIDLTAATGLGFRSDGLTEMATPRTSSRRRHFAIDPRTSLLWLTPVAGKLEGVVRAATVRTDTTDPERQVHRLHVRLQDWAARDVRIGLPNHAIVHRVLIDGVIAPVNTPVQSSEGLDLTVGLPRAGPEIGLEVIYATPQSPWHIASRLHAPIVRLPGAPAVGQIWHFPAGVVPLEGMKWRSDEAAASYDPASPSEWTPPEKATHVWVVREDSITAIGLVFSAAGVIVAALTGGRGRRTPIAVVVAAGLLLVWLPGPLRPAVWWPFVAALIVAAADWVPIRESGRQSSQEIRLTGSSSASNIVVGVTVVAWLGTSGHAAAPAPATVYLVPGADGEAATVLIPADLAEQLRDMERGGVTPLDGARVTAARYTGRIDGPVARVQSSFEIHSFTDGPATLSLPLTGVVLHDAQLDGKPAYPQAAGDRYSVVVRGRGPHVLDMSFQTPVAGTSDDKEIRFGGPDVLQSAMTLNLPPGASFPDAVIRRGAQVVTGTGDRPRLEVDLGRTAAIHVRWQTVAAEAVRATVGVHEAYLWDISGAGATLHGALRYAIGGGSVSSLTVELPKDLLVAAVTARPLEPSLAGAPSSWLRHWQTTEHDKGTRLTLEFGAPVSGNWQIALGLVPRAPWSAGVTLLFPAADGKKAAPPAYAYRARDLAVGLTRTTGVAPMAEEQFLRDRWLPAQVEADSPRPTRAFLRAGGGAPSLRLTISPSAPAVSSAETWTWTIGHEYADVRTESRVSAHGGAVSLLEWDVPPVVRVVDLRGPDVSNWTRTGGRLQVWLRRPLADTTIQWAGTVGRAVTDQAPPAAGPSRFDLPVIRPAGIPFRGTIHITAPNGWLVSPLQTTHLRADESGDVSGRAATYLTESITYQASFHLRPAAREDALRLRTVAAMRDGRFSSDTSIERSGRSTEDESWLITAISSGNTQYRINAPGARVREVATVRDRRAWTVEWPAAPPAAARSLRMTLSATAVATADDDRPPEWGVPHVDLVVSGRRPNSPDRTVTLGGGLSPVQVEGLRPVGTFQPSGESYVVLRDDWLMRVRPATGPREVQLHASTAEFVRGDGGQTIVRLTCELAVPPATTLTWDWPDAVRLRNVRVDDGRLVCRDALTTTYEFALDDRPGVRTVVLEWLPTHSVNAREMPTLIANGRPIVVPFHSRPTPSVEARSWLPPLLRTTLLIGVLGGSLLWLLRFGDAAWPERLTVLGLIGWAAAGGWYWLLPVLAGVVGRARIALQTLNRRRRSASSSSALSS